MDVSIQNTSQKQLSNSAHPNDNNSNWLIDITWYDHHQHSSTWYHLVQIHGSYYPECPILSDSGLLDLFYISNH